MTTPSESCVEHDPEAPADLRWARNLEPSQIDGLYWCWNGRHYARVTKDMLWTTMAVLSRLHEGVPA